MDHDFGGYMENLQKAEAAAARRAQMIAEHEVRDFFVNERKMGRVALTPRAHILLYLFSIVRSGGKPLGEVGSSASSRGWRVT